MTEKEIIRTEKDASIALERSRIKESIRLKKEKQKLGQFEKAITECPECGSHNLIQNYERAEINCRECGLVIDSDIIDPGPEWRAFDSEQYTSRARTGSPRTFTIHDKGLATVIDWRNRDAYGRSLSQEAMARVHRLRRWQRRIRVKGGKERNLTSAFSEMDRMISALGLPKSVHEASALIYRKASEKNLLKGHITESFVSAAIYIVCRQRNIPRTLDEVGFVSRVSRKNIGRDYRFLARELGLKVPRSSPFDYIPRFCSALNLSANARQKAIEILNNAERLGIISQGNPIPQAAAAICIAIDNSGPEDYRTQQEIADATSVTALTVRNSRKNMLAAFDKSGDDFKDTLRRNGSFKRAVVKMDISSVEEEVKNTCQLLRLDSTCKEKAFVLFKEAAEKNFLRGRLLKAVVAVSVYAACKETGFPRDLDEISKVSKVSRRDLGRTYRSMTKKLGLKIKPVMPADFVSHFCSKLSLDGEVQAKAIGILSDSRIQYISGSPPDKAVSAIYIAAILCGNAQLQRVVKEETGVTGVTLRKICSEMVEKLNLKIKLKFLMKN